MLSDPSLPSDIIRSDLYLSEYINVIVDAPLKLIGSFFEINVKGIASENGIMHSSTLKCRQKNQEQ